MGFRRFDTKMYMSNTGATFGIHRYVLIIKCQRRDDPHSSRHLLLTKLACINECNVVPIAIIKYCN